LPPPQAGYEALFHLDHIIASQHVNADDAENRALSCPRCNRKKGPNLAGVDPQTGDVTILFHPRRDVWHDHFQWAGPVLVARTATARATIAALDLNGDDRVRLRLALIAEGIFEATS
jgi:hypothetical protein